MQEWTWTWGGVFCGACYLALSELHLHGFMFHPYMGFFLGVHRSEGTTAFARAGGGDGAAGAAGAASPDGGVGTPPVGGGCQPTMSTYSPLTSLSCMNLNYHVEHHDFPTVPWSALPAVRAAAPEFYDSLAWSPGFTTTVARWLRHGHTWSYACIAAEERAARTMEALTPGFGPEGPEEARA